MTAEDLHRLRKALLRLLEQQTDNEVAIELAEALARLDPSADRRRAQVALLGLLDRETHSWPTWQLAGAVARLAVTPADRRRAQAPLELLARETDNPPAIRLASTLARFDPTSQDRQRARKALLELLARVHTSLEAKALIGAVTLLHPTVRDLDNCSAWPAAPTNPLLTAVRRNSAISVSLAALPSLRI